MSDFTHISTKDACPPAGPYVRPLPLPSPFSLPGPIKPPPPKILLTHSPSLPPTQSQAIKTPHQIYVSGQIPADHTGALVGGSITEQTRQCIRNVAAILAAAGSSVGRVVKVNVFLTDMAHFAEMNAEYERHFGHKPARSCVAVRALPKGVPVEIECVALP